ncbi:MAG TPA: class I SAM-dependent methyltransferase [Methanomicrobiales archaeon]|nr:class I SAM-dependent methyltransferase [Methanomicrobiales archaeon]
MSRRDLPAARPFLPSATALSSFGEFLARPSVPDRLQGLVEAYITKKTGKAWDDPVVLDRIRGAIRAQKGEYWGQADRRAISYRAGYRVLAYLAYQAPVMFVEVMHLLGDMAADGLLTGRMRVLDIGSGPGTVPLAIAETWRRLSPGRVQVFALERETENLEAYRSIVPAFASGAPGVRIEEPLQADLATLDPESLPRDLDLVIFGNVLSEQRELIPVARGRLVEPVAANLSPGGTIIITEPADLENSVALRITTAGLAEKGLSLFAPCTRLWSTSCRPDRCWSFREEAPIVPTRLMARLASSEDGYRYRNTDVKFSYALLRKAGRTREEYRVPHGTKALRLSKLANHLKRRVNVVVAKMSGDLGGRGNHVIKVCDGTPQKPVFAVVPDHQAARARALLEGRYGGIFSLEHVLVRYNPARDGYNLFFDRSSGVGQPGPGKRSQGPGREAGSGRPGQGESGRIVPHRARKSGR